MLFALVHLVLRRTKSRSSQIVRLSSGRRWLTRANRGLAIVRRPHH